MGILSSVESFVGTTLDETSKFLKHDVRAIGVQGSDGVMYSKIQTPAWYPDSLVRSLQKSLYVKMVNSAALYGEGKSNNGIQLDFYEESDDGFFTSLLKSGVKNIVTTAANQITAITSKIDSAISTVKDLFSSKTSESLTESLNNNSSIEFLREQPYVLIKGIHTEENLQSNIKILQSVFSLANKIITGDTKGDYKSMGEFMSSVNKALQTAVKNVYFKQAVVSDNMGEFVMQFLKDDNYRQHSFAEKFMQQVINGTYCMMTKIPYMQDGQVILQSCGESGWTGGVVNMDGLSKKLFEMTGASLGWANPINWTAQSVSGCTPFKCTFDIFNDTFEHFLINYAFILSFMSTTKATTDLLSVRAPYLYDIEIPSGSRYRLCKCSASVASKGMMRKLGKVSDIQSLMKSCFGVTINERAVEYVPDMYTVSLEFTSLIPDLWNFVDSYVKALDEGDAQMGETIDTKLAAFINEFTNQL